MAAATTCERCYAFFLYEKKQPACRRRTRRFQDNTGDLFKKNRARTTVMSSSMNNLIFFKHNINTDKSILNDLILKATTQSSAMKPFDYFVKQS
jgi:hypothetical protein